MVKKINFDKDALKHAKNQFKKVQPAEEQIDIINDLINIGMKYLSLNKSALGYFVMESIKDWQNSSSHSVQDIKNMNPNDRINAITIILNNVRKRLINILLIMDDKEDLDKAIDEALVAYKEKYANR